MVSNLRRIKIKKKIKNINNMDSNDKIKNRFICECGSVLNNHYPYQVNNHRLSKKHALRLIQRIIDIEKKEKEEKKKEEKQGSITLEFT